MHFRHRELLLLLCAFGALTAATNVDAQITTAQYDNQRTGANLHESILKPANVNVNSFGKLFRIAVDGDVYAQPLFLPSLAIPGRGSHDVLFVATERDSVYAFDLDARPPSAIWQTSFIDPAHGISPVSDQSAQCPFISPDIGITSTPVIDTQSGTLYVLARTVEVDNSGTKRFWQRLHALDVTSGKEKFGGPVAIHASMSIPHGSSFGLLPATLNFSPLRENPRAALALADAAFISPGLPPAMWARTTVGSWRTTRRR